ncbi:hypothetical protein KKH27_08140 [bacterium]|nr:hypothetical protein [bacterium]
MDYAGHIVAFMAIYGLLACSLGLLVGQAGIFSVAHAAFFGIGAYTSVLLVRSYPKTSFSSSIVHPRWRKPWNSVVDFSQRMHSRR